MRYENSNAQTVMEFAKEYRHFIDSHGNVAQKKLLKTTARRIERRTRRQRIMLERRTDGD